MRIIAGEWRGRPLVAPANGSTRPTADRVRETLFSMLLSRLGSFEDLRVADLFAGSGALGLEALSRGAASVTFVESDAEALKAIRFNVEKLKATDRARLLGGSAFALAKSEGFDLVLADPPYADGSGSRAITAVHSAGWLNQGGWMSVETARKQVVDPGPYETEAERDVGPARITLLRRP